MKSVIGITPESVHVSITPWVCFMDKRDYIRDSSIRAYIALCICDGLLVLLPVALLPWGDVARKCALLERLWEEEALLHVIMAGRRGVDVPDPGEAGLHSTVLLQGLTTDGNILFAGQSIKLLLAASGFIVQTEWITLWSLIHVCGLFHFWAVTESNIVQTAQRKSWGIWVKHSYLALILCTARKSLSQQQCVNAHGKKE